MKLFSTNLAIGLLLFSASIAQAQTPTPFTGCPATTVAITRGGGNAYSNEPVSFYTLNPVTANATLVPGGPLKNPLLPALNFDMNAVGLNSGDGLLYGINPGLLPRFYRMGSNYAIQQVGLLAAPSVNFPLLSFVNSAAGEFDNNGNYYFTAASGFITPAPGFSPFEFYIGKLSGVASLPAGTGTLTPTYTKLNFGNANCGEYLNTLQTAVSVETAQNTGLRDLAYNTIDNKLYTYVTFEYPANSGIFKGQLLSADPVTGTVTCYPSSVLSFANASNEVAGVAITFAGDLLVLFTNGSVYKAVAASAGVYTGAITLVNPASVAAPLRGDLASCGGASGGPTPVVFESFTATENRCVLNYQWVISAEVNVRQYELEVQNADGNFVKVGTVPAANTGSRHTYSLQVPADGRTIIARVRSVDNDGRSMYSQVVQTQTNCTGQARVILLNSMEVNSTLTAKWSGIATAGRFQVSIFNSVGAKVLNQQLFVNAGVTTSMIDVQRLPAGTYIFVAQKENGERYNVTFVKKGS